MYIFLFNIKIMTFRTNILSFTINYNMVIISNKRRIKRFIMPFRGIIYCY